MNNLKFLKTNNRIDVIYSGVFTKIVGILNVFFLTYVLLPNDYGNLAYVLSLINIITPFLGLGLNQSLLRYGNITSNEKLDSLTSFALYRGSLITFFETIILLIFVYFVNADSEIFRISKIVCLQLLLSYPLIILQSKLRLERKNKDYAKTVFMNSASLLLFLVLGYYTFGFNGVLVAYVVYPIASFIFSLGKNYSVLKFSRFNNDIKKLELYKYGFFIGLASVASQMLYSMDIIMLKKILVAAESVAIYKVASLISVNGLIFCNNIMSADFVHIKEMNIANLNKYTKKLLSRLFIFSMIIFIASIPFVYIATYHILNVIYKESFFIHIVLMVGFVFSFSIRIPIGIILSARGYANYNVNNAYISLGLNFLLNIILIKKLGCLGAALATVFTMIAGSLISIYLLKKAMK